jgi:hypothetical protein
MEATKPIPLNWSPNYTKKVSIPLGAKAINLHFENEMEKNPSVTELDKSTYEAFQQKEIEENGSLLYFNNFLNFDKETLEKLLNWVDEGNTVFMSAHNFPEKLKDTLEVKIEPFLFNFQFIYHNELKLVNPAFGDTSYTSATDYEANYFSEIDTNSHRVLGYIKPVAESDEAEKESIDLVNFIEVEFGNGKLLLHTFPQAFGNHFFVHEENYKYTTNTLQYINWQKPVYIDQYYKSGREGVDSLLYYVTQNRALKWAYYTSILASIIFVFIQGKRKQKPIPIQEALTNKTYEYTKTVANMFLENNAHKEIATKQIKQLMNYIRKNYQISTREINQQFYKELALKSAQDVNLVKNLFEHIKYIEARDAITKEDLMKFDEQLSKIKK